LDLSLQAISSVGGSQPHTNFQPYLCVDFIISLFGIFPSPT
jgi:microcystin-dependent protein